MQDHITTQISAFPIPMPRCAVEKLLYVGLSPPVGTKP